MKAETLSTFITARMLFEHASELCVVDDKHMASAGLVVLQDAIELVLYACLKELGVDEEKPIETFSFDQMIGELKKKKRKLPKSDTLKALNKQRVIIKHYGQVTDPTTVLNYYEGARHAVDSLMQDVVGKTLQDILIHEAIRKEEIKGYIANANKHIGEKKYFSALAEIRKAIFIEIEQDYSVYDWRDHPRNKEVGLLEMLGKGGFKAPWHTRNKEWIEENIHKPFDYVQLDHEKLRIDLLEWGVSTVDFWNLWRLTPPVFFDKESSDWKVNLDLQHLRGSATEENARYCLDRAVSLLVKKQNHFDLTRQLEYGPEYRFKVKMREDAPLFAKASSLSLQTNVLIKDHVYFAEAIVPGLGGKEDFVQILHTQEKKPKYLFGFVDYELCQLIEE